MLVSPKKTPKEPTFHITILPIGFFSFLFFFVPFSILSFSSILYSSFLTIIPHLLIFFLLKSQIFSSHDSFNFHYLHLICVHILVYFNPHPDIVLKSTHLRKHFYLPPSQLFFESISDWQQRLLRAVLIQQNHHKMNKPWECQMWKKGEVEIMEPTK